MKTVGDIYKMVDNLQCETRLEGHMQEILTAITEKLAELEASQRGTDNYTGCISHAKAELKRGY